MKRILLLPLLLLLLGGCLYGGIPPAGRDEIGPGPSAEAEENGLRLELWCDRMCYTAGETIRATLRLTNTGGTDRTLGADAASSDDSDPLLLCAILDDGLTLLPRTGEHPQEAGVSDLCGKTLSPGESAESSVYLSTRYLRGKSRLDAWDGIHTLRASVSIPEAGEEPLSVSLSLQFRISEGGPRTITPEQAIGAVSGDAAYILWYELHTGGSIAREDHGNYFYHNGSKWQSCDREQYENLLLDPGIRISADYRDGEYLVVCSSLYGDASEYTARVDAKTGKILK